MAFSGALIVPTLAATAVTAGATIYQGEQARKAGVKSLRAQTKAQEQAQANAVGQQRKADMAANAARSKTPDLGKLLGSAEQDALKGAASTLLTGGAEKPKLSKTTLLGA